MKHRAIIYTIFLLLAISSAACRSRYPAAPYHYWHHTSGPRRHFGAPRVFTPYNIYLSPHHRGHKAFWYKGRYRP